jgi:hypothetical protein
MEIRIQDQDSKGTTVAINDGVEIAEMTYSKAGTKQIIINHMEVNNSVQRQGIGRQLLEVIVTYARDNHRKIIPLCPFARREFDKDDSLHDELKQRL